MDKQRLGRDCRLTWGVPRSQLDLMQDSGISLSHGLESRALAAPFPQPPAGTQAPTAWLDPELTRFAEC